MASMLERLLPIAATGLARSLRVRWESAGHACPLPERAVVMFWHGDMYAGWWAVAKRKPVALVSQSKDGELLASVLEKWGYKLARGSSRKKGREALQCAIDLVAAGEANVLAITPDGPTGPPREFKRGAFLAAQELGLPLYLLRIHYSKRRELHSWDKFRLPMPFSRLRIEVKEVSLEGWPSEMEEQHAWLDRLARSLEAHRW